MQVKHHMDIYHKNHEIYKLVVVCKLKNKTAHHNIKHNHQQYIFHAILSTM